MTTRHLYVASRLPTCAACRKPMTPVDGHDTHPCCDPVVGWPPFGGGAARRDQQHRQLRLVDDQPRE